MADSGFVTAIGAIGVTTTVIQLLTQQRDIRRSATPLGVSVLTWDLALVQSTGLGAFALSKHHPAALIANVLVALLCVAILGSLPDRKKSLGVGVVIVCAVASAWRLASADLAGMIGAAASAVVWLPQAARSTRTHDSRGLSLQMVALGVTSSTAWLAYAVLVEEWQFAIAPVSGLLGLAATGFAIRRSPRP